MSSLGCRGQVARLTFPPPPLLRAKSSHPAALPPPSLESRLGHPAALHPSFTAALQDADGITAPLGQPVGARLLVDRSLLADESPGLVGDLGRTQSDAENVLVVVVRVLRTTGLVS